MKQYEISYVDAFVSSFGGLVVNWGAKGKGFGEMYLSVDKESGKIKLDSEFCSKEFTKEVFQKLIEDAIFTDFTETTKHSETISLQDADVMFDFVPHVLQTPFQTQEDKTDPSLIQHRWHVKDGKVLNVWFNKEEVEEDYFTFSSEINKNQTFAKGFKKAELWSWEYKEKVKN